MSKKGTVTNLLKTINSEWCAADKKIKDAYANNDYSLEFKDRIAAEIMTKLNNTLDQVKVMITETVDKKLEELFSPGANTFDAAYQSRLTNVLSIVTLAGSDIDLRDLKSMIEPFNKDYTALQAIKAAITAAGVTQRTDYPEILSDLATNALKDRQETHRKLVKFKDSLNGFNISSNMRTLEWLLNSEYLGYDEFISSLDGDLNYVSKYPINETIKIDSEIK